MKTDGRIRNNISKGMEVAVVTKKDQLSGRLTRGIVRNILTRSKNHPRGIKVKLENGKVGRVKEIVVHKNV
jgi:uncharacterized repeat protein (TIGR03833 family)